MFLVFVLRNNFWLEVNFSVMHCTINSRCTCLLLLNVVLVLKNSFGPEKKSLEVSSGTKICGLLALASSH